jgi:hypothetical protein
MAPIANDLAFFGDHAVAALRAGIEKFLSFAEDRAIFNHAAEVQKGRQRRNRRFRVSVFFVHKTSLSRRFYPLNADLLPSFVLDSRPQAN